MRRARQRRKKLQRLNQSLASLKRRKTVRKSKPTPAFFSHLLPRCPNCTRTANDSAVPNLQTNVNGFHRSILFRLSPSATAPAGSLTRSLQHCCSRKQVRLHRRIRAPTTPTTHLRNHSRISVKNETCATYCDNIWLVASTRFQLQRRQNRHDSAPRPDSAKPFASAKKVAKVLSKAQLPWTQQALQALRTSPAASFLSFAFLHVRM